MKLRTIKKNKLKLVGYVVLVILILNMILFGMGKINWIVFWVIIALGFILVKFVLPKLK